MGELLSPEDVAILCGLSRKAVYRAIERGELRAARLCSRLRVRAEDVDRWIDGCIVSVPASVAPVPVPSRVGAANGLRARLDSARQSPP